MANRCGICGKTADELAAEILKQPNYSRNVISVRVGTALGTELCDEHEEVLRIVFSSLMEERETEGK